MEIHNLLEEKVKNSVDEYCQSSTFDREKYCDCIQCRLDVACYVLNNSAPKYVISSRGIVHHELEYSKKLQMDADIFHLVKEGFSVISSRKRFGTDHNKRTEEFFKDGFYFNFPNIIGKIINGKTFEPVSNADVKLYLDDNLVKMTSEMTSNPVILSEYTGGLFIFWPYPIEAEENNITKTFTFKIIVSHPDFAEFTKLIDVESTSQDSIQDSIHLQNTLNMDEIYLFNRGV